MDEPRWVSRVAVEALHFLQLAEHGGLRGVRDVGLLESALSRPRHIWAYNPGTDAPALAAAYAWGILRNHPFHDGNKRTAFLAAIAFLGLNGHGFTAPEDAVVRLMTDAAASRVDEAELTTWFRKYSRRRRKRR